uniref:ATP synthase complex subunit 8 n=1 Tax=Anaspis sp. BMNH 840206 TaxID=904161 RepID=E3VT15_9CUCU|nr:ATP synthase F0 subunit 8 [Anaspis sp. BMNH 840206]
MPQMAPLNWLTLMIYFIIIFMIFNIMNYYSYSYKNSDFSSKKKKIINLNWKW